MVFHQRDVLGRLDFTGVRYRWLVDVSSGLLPVLIVGFLLAGVNLPVGTVWTAARWLFLAAGAIFGLLITIGERRYHFGPFFFDSHGPTFSNGFAVSQCGAFEDPEPNLALPLRLDRSESCSYRT